MQEILLLILILAAYAYFIVRHTSRYAEYMEELYERCLRETEKDKDND